MQEQEWLTLREAADALGISEVSARRWVKSGKLAAAQPGRKYLIPRSAVEELLSPKASASSQPSFNGLLEEERRSEAAEAEARARVEDSPKQARLRSFYAEIKGLDSETLAERLAETAQQLTRVDAEWARAREEDPAGPAAASLASQRDILSGFALMLSLQRRLAINPDARWEEAIQALIRNAA